MKGEARGSIVGTAGERALPGVVHGERSMRVAASSCAPRQHGEGWFGLVTCRQQPGTCRMQGAQQALCLVHIGIQPALERIAVWATCGG